MDVINKKIALIPVYEPSELFIELVQQLYTEHFKIIIVDDGSSSNFSCIFDIAAGYATVLKHPINRGKGAALKTGFAFIQTHFSEDFVIVTLDADGQHRVEDAVKVCEAAIKNPACIVLGSRSFKGNVPARSRFGNTLTKSIYGIFTGVHIQDTQTGLRAFCAGLLPFFMEIPGDRYEYEMNVLLKCTHTHLPIKEVAIETIYMDDNASSHFHALKDSFLIYKNILKFSASSFIAFLVDYGFYSLFIIITTHWGWYNGVQLSNIMARTISSITNFTINKKFVFKNTDSLLKTAIQYFSLVILIMSGNTILLTYLVHTIHVNRFLAKAFTEITFFVFSWMVQQYLIFRNKTKKHEINLDEP